MPLVSIFMEVLFSIVLAACVSAKSVTPADRGIHGETFRYDCCDPGLDEGTKWLCDMARKRADRTLTDTDENKSVFIWSNCEEGKEPWRKYE